MCAERRARVDVDTVLAVVALLRLLTFCGSNYYTSSPSWCCRTQFQHASGDREVRCSWGPFSTRYGLFVIEALTIPVTLMMLGLPIRL